jgi:hypothetical protein
MIDLQSSHTKLIISASGAVNEFGINTHCVLIKAGVTADLHVWDGLNQAFF